MSEYAYKMQWPRDNLSVDAFAHEILNYRYHWHPAEYELNILLRGRQEFCRGRENYRLEEDDVLLVSPGTGHASFAQEPNTRALVLHFSAAAFRPYVKKGSVLAFPSCCSTPETRRNEAFSQLRYCAAQVYEAAAGGGAYARLDVRAGIGMLMSTLCRCFSPAEQPSGTDEKAQELMGSLIGYLEEHYAEKVTLEDLAAFCQYNRSYVSTLFKATVGVNFYEYLTRLRFQHALQDVASSSKSLTELALDNGFADLKSFNKRFRETLGRTPAEYRALLSPERVAREAEPRRYIPPTDPLVGQKLSAYLQRAPRV